MRNDRRTARAAPALGLVLLAVLGGCVSAQPPGARPGDLSATAESDLATAGRPVEPVAVPSATAAGTTGDPVPVRSAAGVPRPEEVTPPVRLIVERLDADIPVDPVGIAENGQMEIPADAARGGWYRFGAAAGAATGTAVIAAHSGSHITKLGPLRNLAESEPGDTIVVERADGTALRYVVESAALVPKTRIDLARYFRRGGDHRLVLITCDGTWSQERRSYSDNAVVVARLEN